MPKIETISLGQALLILLDYYRENPKKVEQLKKLYLTGPSTRWEMNQIKHILLHEALKNYTVSHDEDVIKNDPSRRFFETHLSSETLKNGLNHIDLSTLQRHCNELYNAAMLNNPFEALVTDTLNGIFDEQTDSSVVKEYTYYISKLHSKELFKALPEAGREKIELLVKCTFLGVLNACLNPLPLDISSQGMYSGKNQTATRNQSLSLMKGHMLLEKNDIERAGGVMPLMKPSDQARFVEGATGVESSFEKKEHLFSNSISCTMLAQLRSIAGLREAGIQTLPETTEKMSEYFRLLISSMLFVSGGHSLNEYTAPIFLPAVRDEFKDIQDFDSMTLSSLFYAGNETSFNTALQDTILYNKPLLLCHRLYAQVANTVSSKEPNFAALIAMDDEGRATDEWGRYAVLLSQLQQEMKAELPNHSRSKHHALLIQQTAKIDQDLQRGDVTSAIETVRALKFMIPRKKFFNFASQSHQWVETLENRLEELGRLKNHLNPTHDETLNPHTIQSR